MALFSIKFVPRNFSLQNVEWGKEIKGKLNGLAETVGLTCVLCRLQSRTFYSNCKDQFLFHKIPPIQREQKYKVEDNSFPLEANFMARYI